jgi:hypothetical protein
MMPCDVPQPAVVYSKPAVFYAVQAGAQGSPRQCHAFVIGFEDRNMFSQIGPAVLPDDMMEYLNDRARETGMSFLDAYCEEMEAKAELRKITPSNAVLLEIAKTSGPPPGLPEEPEKRFW